MLINIYSFNKKLKMSHHKEKDNNIADITNSENADQKEKDCQDQKEKDCQDQKDVDIINLKNSMMKRISTSSYSENDDNWFTVVRAYNPNITNSENADNWLTVERANNPNFGKHLINISLNGPIEPNPLGLQK